jgi:hypothetical protein
MGRKGNLDAPAAAGQRPEHPEERIGYGSSKGISL